MSKMKRSRFTETQIVKAIQEHESGRDAKDICRELGITTVSFYKWRQRYGGLQVPELKRIKELEEENSRLWTTGSETQNLYFDLERSADGVSWTSIATVKGAGTTTTKTSYEAIDYSPLRTDAYYRLKQVDISGSFSYSNIIRVPANNE